VRTSGLVSRVHRHQPEQGSKVGRSKNAVANPAAQRELRQGALYREAAPPAASERR